jgi:hypothetical protein
MQAYREDEAELHVSGGLVLFLGVSMFVGTLPERLYPGSFDI